MDIFLLISTILSVVLLKAFFYCLIFFNKPIILRKILATIILGGGIVNFIGNSIDALIAKEYCFYPVFLEIFLFNISISSVGVWELIKCRQSNKKIMNENKE